MLISQLKPGNKYPTVLWSLSVTAVTGNINERGDDLEKTGSQLDPNNSHITHLTRTFSPWWKEPDESAATPRKSLEIDHIYFWKLQTLKVLEKYFFLDLLVFVAFLSLGINAKISAVYISVRKQGLEDFPIE